MGSHKGAHLALRLPNGAAQQLDLIAAGVGVGHVGQGHSPDALGGHLVGIHMLSEGQGGQNADLPAGILAVYIGRGITSAVGSCSA